MGLPWFGTKSLTASGVRRERGVMAKGGVKKGITSISGDVEVTATGGSLEGWGPHGEGQKAVGIAAP
jgi:hypothetical protein